MIEPISDQLKAVVRQFIVPMLSRFGRNKISDFAGFRNPGKGFKDNVSVLDVDSRVQNYTHGFSNDTNREKMFVRAS